MDSEEAIERRIVTVLFADLVGFTTLSEQFDAEDIAGIQDSYFADVRETIGRYGGQLEKFIGDAAMAVFGVPRSRDDDAERAVRAGLALVGGVQQLGARLGLEEDALRLRVGVNTGEVVVSAAGAEDGRVTGDTVNTAARLQAAAPPNGVLAGETTALAVAGIAELGPVTELALKGKAEPTRARLVEGLRLEPSRDAAMGRLRAPTLGRDHEIGELVAAQARTAQGGCERWLVIAPPGVGKSRLLDELAGRIAGAAKHGVVWRSRTRTGSISPFEAVAALLRSATASEAPGSQADELRAALRASGMDEARAAVVVGACLSILSPGAEPGAGPGTEPVEESGDDPRAQTGAERAAGSAPTDDRDTLFAAWLDGLDALASGRPQVWLIEDVHWAGGDFLAFLALAATRPPNNAGRLVVATTRPSLLDTNPEWVATEPDEGRHTMQLATLDTTDARAMIEALVGSALPAELVERIAQRSDGNCLFIEELLRTWISVGTLVREDDSWTLSVPAEEIPLPANVQSIYAAQLDDLPPDARRLARRASVAGRRFPFRALEPLGAGAGDGLSPLIRRELVSGPTTHPITGEAYAYRHALLRDAGYASLARAERARLHARLARWLEQAAGERSAEVAEQIAGHYSAALQSAPALATQIDDGLDRDTVRRLAAEWYERAGQGTLALSAHDAARQLFRSAIDMTPDDETLEKARRWERLGDATAFAADMDEGAAAYQRAMELYRGVIGSVGSGFDKGAAALDAASTALARQAEWLGSISAEGAAAMLAGVSELRAGAAGMERGRDELVASLSAARSGLARSAASLADVMYQQLRFEESRQLAEQVTAELGEDADAASRARLMVASAMGALGAGGPTPEIGEQMERGVELARESDDPQLALKALHSLTIARTEMGREDLAVWEEVADAAERIGDWATVVSAGRNAAMNLLDDQAGAVFEALARVRHVATARGLTEDVGWSDYIEAEAAFVTGDWDRAVASGLRAIDLGETNAYLRLTVRTLHVLVPIASVRGDQALMARAARWYASLEGKFEFPDSPYARIVRAAQDLELGAAGLREFVMPDVASRIASFDEYGAGSWSAAIDRVFRAWIEAGELDGAQRALEHLEAARARAASPSTSLATGTYLLMCARLALARSRADKSIALARDALNNFREISAPWWMAKAIRLLERSGAADEQLGVEVKRIEQQLRVVRPTD